MRMPGDAAAHRAFCCPIGQQRSVLTQHSELEAIGQDRVATWRLGGEGGDGLGARVPGSRSTYLLEVRMQERIDSSVIVAEGRIVKRRLQGQEKVAEHDGVGCGGGGLVHCVAVVRPASERCGVA